MFPILRIFFDRITGLTKPLYHAHHVYPVILLSCYPVKSVSITKMGNIWLISEKVAHL